MYYFYEVARYSSIKEASKVLELSLPTISEQIKRLENELDVKLFKRSVRRLDLTSEGQSLFLIVKEMFKYGPKIFENVSCNSIGGTPVKIGIQEGVTLEYSSNLIYQYWNKYISYGTIGSERIFVIEELILGILKGVYDWGISWEISANSRIDSIKIGSAEILFCCSENIFKIFKDKKNILKHIPFARNPFDTLLNEKVLDHLTLNHCIPHEFIDIEQKELCLDLIHKDRCVSVLTEQTIKKLNTSDNIKGFHIEKPISLDFYALWLKGKDKTLIIKKLLELLKEEFHTELHDTYLQLKIIDIPLEMLFKTI
ncbi:MAG: LysR family transcriptional regulator [Oligoflexia bacterium]|nr:LysR family transcriptional regulator [Oligoflexia bacterium]